MQIVKKKYHNLAPLCKGELLLLSQAQPTIEGLLAEVFAEVEIIGAAIPQSWRQIGFARFGRYGVSRIIVVFETSRSCRKPAPVELT